MRCTLVAAILFAGVAHADPTETAAPDDIVARPLVLAAGSFDIRLTIEANLQDRYMARPLSYAPDAWWGISPRWTIGVIHSNASLDRIDAGETFCIRESDISTCNRLYRGSGLDVRFAALAGHFAIAPRLRLLVRDIDPFKPAMTTGALLRWTAGRYAIVGDPYVRIPLWNREDGNRASLFLPVWFALQPTRGVALALHTGVDGDFAVLRDGWHMPLGLVFEKTLGNELEVAIEAGWAKLLGPQHDAKQGALMITAGWHR